jgi:hypothetical protein
VVLSNLVLGNIEIAIEEMKSVNQMVMKRRAAIFRPFLKVMIFHEVGMQDRY